MIAAIPTQLLLDSAATRFAPERAGGRRIAVNLAITDRNEGVGIEAGPSTLIARMTPLADAAATLTGPRPLFLGLFFAKAPLAQLEAAGLKIEGDRAAVEALANALDPLPGPFPIAEP